MGGYSASVCWRLAKTNSPTVETVRLPAFLYPIALDAGLAGIAATRGFGAYSWVSTVMPRGAVVVRVIMFRWTRPHSQVPMRQ